MPPLLDATKSGRFSLRAQAGETNFLNRSASKAIGFNQAYLGPVIRVTRGETEVVVKNALNRPVSTHWHGLLIPGEVDGVSTVRRDGADFLIRRDLIEKVR